jgi:hypothetical protein
MNAQAEMTAAVSADSGRLAYDLRELASMLGCSVELLRKEIGRDRLRPSRLGRRIVIARTEAIRYLEATQASGR